ncbi:MAG: TraB/GumN family protein [Flavobacteriales bacterium]
MNIAKNLRSSIAAAVLLVVGHSATAQKTLLFEISKGNERPSYVYGTMHINEPGFNACEAKLSGYVAKCTTFSGELNMEDVQPTPELAMKMLMLNTSLSALYTVEEYAKVKAYLEEKLGPMAAQMESFKPFWIMATVMQIGERTALGTTDIGEVVDARLQQSAKASGLKIQPLETLDEQLGAIDGISLEEQAQMLLESIDQDEDELMDKMKACYTKADLDCMESLYNDNRFTSSAEGVLVVNRNKTMHERLLKLIESGESVFCAVGALHLAGEEGLIELLKESGYAVKPVNYLPCN